MRIKLAAPLQSDSIVDGEGIRAVLWTQGCAHHCPGCHNAETWDFDGGYYEDTEEIKKQLGELKGQDGITFSGGDPMYQIKACLDIAKYAKEIGLNVWCYTGYTYEELRKLDDPNILEFLFYIDVLVDGPFILKERSLDLIFKGSRNQRLLDMKKTLEQGKPVIVSKYQSEKSVAPLYKREDCIYI